MFTKLKKILLSLTVIIGFTAYAFSERKTPASSVISLNIPTPSPTMAVITTTPTPSQTQTTSTPTPPPTKTSPTPTPTKPPTPTPTHTPTATPMPPATPTPTPQGQYKNGQYTGDSVDAYYGNIQVKAIITNGKISDVVFLDYPQDRNTSIEINTQAMPYLKAEAIAAQNANVDIVSGATESSLAFRTSLASALKQAKM